MKVLLPKEAPRREPIEALEFRASRPGIVVSCWLARRVSLGSSDTDRRGAVMPDQFDAATAWRWAGAMAERLGDYGPVLDALNVFPVADEDTGANLAATWRSAFAAVVEPPQAGSGSNEAVGDALSRIAAGALRGARGSSGVITAAWLRGFAEACEGADLVDDQLLVRAAVDAATYARNAVAEPVEGTVLTVASSLARVGAELAPEELARDPRGPLIAVVAAMTRGATDALRDSPRHLPVLAAAGVVDAGGAGLVLAWESLLALLVDDDPDGSVLDQLGRADRGALETDADADAAYEVEFTVACPAERVEPLRATLAGLGDSLVLVPIAPLAPASQVLSSVRVHVHTADAGAVIEAALAAGAPSDVRITALPGAAHRPGGSGTSGGAAVVVLCSLPGVSELLTDAGASVCAPVHDDSPAAPAGVVAAVLATGAKHVLLVTSGSPRLQLREVVRACRDCGVDVALVPTESPVQSLAAVLVRDPLAPSAEQAIAMARAAASTRWAEVSVAERAALTSAGPCVAGSALGLIGGDVVIVGTDTDDVAVDVLDRMLAGGGELVTAVLGLHPGDQLAQRLRAHVLRHWPFVEFHSVPAGIDGRIVLLGVE